MSTDDQRKAADEIASKYTDTVRITPNQGPLEDRITIRCPDGRYVVLGLGGVKIADSAE